MHVADSDRALALVLVGDDALPEEHRVWGTGGWLPPEEREALDWLTLLRLCGWNAGLVRTHSLRAADARGAGARWIVIAGNLAGLSEEAVRWLAARLQHERVLVVTRAGEAGSALAHVAGAARRPERIMGRRVQWNGAGGSRDWQSRVDLEADSLSVAPDVVTWATLDGAPLIVARRVGLGTIATLSFHPSAARDVDGAATALLRHLLVWGSDRPVAWLDLEGCLVLRMDDPGGAQNIYSRSWSHSKITEAEWAALGVDLRRRQGRIAIAYVSGWVDDGDAQRGSLTVNGAAAPRRPGAVHPSPLVRYIDRAGHAPGTIHDYEAEYRGIQALRRAGLADVELHGHTHIHPDVCAWAAAPDQYEAMSWFRELGAAAVPAIRARPPEQHPLTLGSHALQAYFGVWPTTLVSPGDEWTNEVLEHALALGIQLVDSYYLALRHDDRYCWSQHVCAPYLDRPDAAWFDAGLPVVGYCHDRDLVDGGVEWFTGALDAWQSAGARRLIDFRELASALACSLDVKGLPGSEQLVVTRTQEPLPVRAIPVLMRYPLGNVPSRAILSVNGRQSLVDVADLGNGIGRALLPPEAHAGA